MSQASYDLARLHGNGLIGRIDRTNAYRLTADGLTFAWSTAVFTTRSCIRSPPTTADRRPADIRAACWTITRHIDRIAAAALIGGVA